MKLYWKLETGRQKFLKHILCIVLLSGFSPSFLFLICLFGLVGIGFHTFFFSQTYQTLREWREKLKANFFLFSPRQSEEKKNYASCSLQKVIVERKTSQTWHSSLECISIRMFPTAKEGGSNVTKYHITSVDRRSTRQSDIFFQGCLVKCYLKNNFNLKNFRGGNM